MNRFVIATLFAILTASGATAQMAALGDVSSSGDADHLEVLRVRAGGLGGYESPFRYAGAVAQTTHYAQSGWHTGAPAVLFLWRNQSRETLAGSAGEAGLVRVAGRTRLIGDATWGLRPTARTGIEFVGASDVVETRRALETATAYAFGAVSLEQDLTRRLTAIGLAGVQRFTDGNQRLHLRGRLIWLLVPEQGISAQLRFRQYHSSDLAVDDAYFNPGSYREWQGALAMRKRHAGWVYSGTLAAGQEEIDGKARHATRLAEVRAEGPLGKRMRLTVHASYNRSAGFGSANGYWYRSAGVSLIVPF